jgi:hypothetical protein
MVNSTRYRYLYVLFKIIYLDFLFYCYRISANGNFSILSALDLVTFDCNRHAITVTIRPYPSSSCEH